MKNLFLLGTVLFALASLRVSAAPLQQLQGHVPREVGIYHLAPLGRLAATNQLHLAISLPFRQPDVLGQLLRDLQNPASTNYHHYLTPQQFNERFAPNPADYAALVQFAVTNGLTVTRTHPGRGMISVDGAVADVERALHVTLRTYQHPAELRQFYAPDVEPSLDLAVPVLAIGGLDNYSLPHPRLHALSAEEIAQSRAGSYNDPQGGTLLMGSDFRHAFVPGTSLNGSGQSVGLLELDGYTPADISAYESTAGLPNVPVQEVPVDGAANNTDNGDAETPLDVEMAICMAPSLTKVVYYHGYGSDIDGILTEMADPSDGEPLPLQLSSSWGCGVDNGTTNCFARLAAQGQSYFYASGDSGALPVDPNGPNGTYINGADPSDLEPYMTQVGGTDLNMNGVGASWQSETVWGASGSNTGGGPSGSSGGVQTSIPIPDYQQSINMTAVGGSSSHRNVPDVAMPANYILVVVTDTNGVQHYVAEGGTSCAAPLWAGFTALVNQQAAAQDQPSLGFANPALYQIAGTSVYTNCFHDITSGNNTWSNSPSLYYAAKGYDLCTGLGSPSGTNLINALIGLSGAVYVQFGYAGSPQNGSYLQPYGALSQGVNAVSGGGTIFLLNGGSSAATTSVTKPMTITAQNGAATIIN